jgi:hypothetical protein
VQPTAVKLDRAEAVMNSSSLNERRLVLLDQAVHESYSTQVLLWKGIHYLKK